MLGKHTLIRKLERKINEPNYTFQTKGKKVNWVFIQKTTALALFLIVFFSNIKESKKNTEIFISKQKTRTREICFLLRQLNKHETRISVGNFLYECLDKVRAFLLLTSSKVLRRKFSTFSLGEFLI
jgi:hypothetical protein